MANQHLRHRDLIQKEVDKILAFSSETDWMKFLEAKGRGHRMYYHYTTLKTLKAILETSSWKLKRADFSNDPLECPVHNISFTSGLLSSMEMWEMYSCLSSAEDIGVRIGIPDSVFKDIFGKDAVWYSRDSEGMFHEFSKKVPKITDMAYWHFGKDDGSSLAIYRNYRFPGKSLHFHFPKGKQLPPYFKTAIWRNEEEVRVFCDFSEEKNIPDSLYIKIKPEHFNSMTFRLSPSVTDHIKLKNLFQTNTVQEEFWFFLSRILCGKLSIQQFKMPNEYEQYQEPNYES